MRMVLERKFFTDKYTEGNLYIDGKWFCHVIEDVVRAKPNKWKSSLKVWGKTAIPYGTYPVLVTWSGKFKRQLTGIFNVPDFEGIRIHNGKNETSSAGCLIVSYKAGKGYVVNDKKAMNDICDMVTEAQKKGKIFIDIIEYTAAK
jgi:hypothetical protein